MEFEQHNFILPDKLRHELSKPIGELIEGTIEDTIPQLKERLIPHEKLLVAVGDVTAEILIENEFKPDLVITDGKTKREKLENWKEWKGYHIMTATCPAAEITSDTWKVLQKAVKQSQIQPVHVKINGEEDLLVLPLIIELPISSTIVYGQPNRGAVIRKVDGNARDRARSILLKMDIRQDN